MMLEIGVGDSYGAGFEFAKPERLAQIKNDLSIYYPHNLPGHLPPGSYTDDTQMSIAIAEILLMSRKHWNIEEIADKFVEVYKRDPRNGYSRGLQSILDKPDITNGSALRSVLVPVSDRCGAAMRSVPIGLIRDIPELLRFCQTQASITHNTSAGIKSSQAVALAAHFYKYNPKGFANLEQFIQVHTKDYETRWCTWSKGRVVSTSAHEVVRAALFAVTTLGSQSEMLKQSIDYKGDVDSVAAIAMGVSSLKSDAEKDLPVYLQLGLEDTTYGRAYLVELDKRLASVNL